MNECQRGRENQRRRGPGNRGGGARRYGQPRRDAHGAAGPPACPHCRAPARGIEARASYPLLQPPAAPLGAPASTRGPLVQDGCPTPRLQRAVWGWVKLGFLAAGVLAGLGGGGYLCALAISVMAGAIAALAAGLQALGTALVICAVGVFLLMALGSKR